MRSKNKIECYIKIGDDLIDAEFIGIYQYSKVINPSPMAGGHPGGVIAYPVAVVKIDSQFKQVDLLDVLMVEED